MDVDNAARENRLGASRLRVVLRDHVHSPQQHQNDDALQLLHASRGVMRVTVADGHWVVPPGRGIWIPARTPHELRVAGPASICVLYVEAASPPDGSGECSIVAIPPLAQGLLRELAAAEPCTERRNAIEALLRIELTRLHPISMPVAMPRDARLRKLCTRLLARPRDGRTLDEHAHQVGASARTLRRLFQDELGMSFATWRQDVRLSEAQARLADREPVAKVARDLGYATPSAFIAMFKRGTGLSPRGWLQSFSSFQAPSFTTMSTRPRSSNPEWSCGDRL